MQGNVGPYGHRPTQWWQLTPRGTGVYPAADATRRQLYMGECRMIMGVITGFPQPLGPQYVYTGRSPPPPPPEMGAYMKRVHGELAHVGPRSDGHGTQQRVG
jgi:hypothetical protein